MNGIAKQRAAQKIGESGCYFLSVAELAERMTGETCDVIETYARALEKGWIDEDCYMERPDLILQYLTGLRAMVKKESAEYECAENESVIGCFEWRATGTTYYHFALIDGKNKSVIYDPLGNSNTIKNGSLHSLRVFTVGA